MPQNMAGFDRLKILVVKCYHFVDLKEEMVLITKAVVPLPFAPPPSGSFSPAFFDLRHYSLIFLVLATIPVKSVSPRFFCLASLQLDLPCSCNNSCEICFFLTVILQSVIVIKPNQVKQVSIWSISISEICYSQSRRSCFNH